MIQFYLKVFVPSPSYGASSNMVDISELIEQGNTCSPIQLQYSDKGASLKNLASAIVKNICTSYAQTKKFPKRGIESLTNIIGKSMDSPETAAKQIFLVHISKRKMDVDLCSYLIVMTDKMCVKSVLAEDENKWVELAKKVTRNKQINDIIDECIADFARIPQLLDEKIDVKITIVEKHTSFLRGFVGFDEIYIHADAVQEKIDASKSDDLEILQLVTKMDIISIALHELAHLKIRKRVGDFNAHTPVLAATNANEFGVYVERKIFNKQVDWFKSSETVDIQYVERFIFAIENDCQLPSEFIEGALPRSGMTDVGGADIQLTSCVC